MKLRDAAKLLLSPSELGARRELARIRKQPRFTAGMTALFGCPFEYVDSSSFCFLHEEIFDREIYSFTAKNPAPRIIDGGANIGMSALYFKKAHPQSRITAFEADPAIAAVLRRNVEAQDLTDVEIRSEALWSERTEIAFAPEGADAGKVGDAGNAIRVPAVPLADFLGEPVDFLKLDIEGAEWEVLKSCAGHLGAVDKLFVEYHSPADAPQHLAELLALLESGGFRCYISSPSVFSPQPLREVKTYCGFDMVLNIFGIRPDAAP